MLGLFDFKETTKKTQQIRSFVMPRICVIKLLVLCENGLC